MSKLILASHGSLAEGMKSALKMILGESIHMDAFGLDTWEQPQAILEEILKIRSSDPEEELIVIYDDISLEPGKIRIRKKGSAGGHNGIKNIIAQLGTQNFQRIKVGVGEKPKGWDLADYVLGRVSKEEQPIIRESADRAREAVCEMITHDVASAMNKFN